MKNSPDIVKEIGALYGSLWPDYDDRLFWESVDLFARRFQANDFDLNWFKGKTCLDAGCGGGRYSIAMARLGAAHVTGIDISTNGLADARHRAADMHNVTFREASVLDLPFPDDSFDFVCCSGVLHHTTHPEKGFKEVCRVLRPGGQIYLLLYATGGIRWPTLLALRPICEEIGFTVIDRAITLAGLLPNKRRMFLDDLFVPVIDFYTWDRLRGILEVNGLNEIQRWEKGWLDHEQDLASLRADIELLVGIFEAGAKSEDETLRQHRERFIVARGWCNTAISTIESYEREVNCGLLSSDEARKTIIGQGNHRVIAKKLKANSQ